MHTGVKVAIGVGIAGVALFILPKAFGGPGKTSMPAKNPPPAAGVDPISNIVTAALHDAPSIIHAISDAFTSGAEE